MCADYWGQIGVELSWNIEKSFIDGYFKPCDRGSIPLSSTQKTLIFQGFLLLYKINLTRHMTDKEYTGQEIFT